MYMCDNNHNENNQNQNPRAPRVSHTMGISGNPARIVFCSFSTFATITVEAADPEHALNTLPVVVVDATIPLSGGMRFIWCINMYRIKHSESALNGPQLLFYDES